MKTKPAFSKLFRWLFLDPPVIFRNNLSTFLLSLFIFVGSGISGFIGSEIMENGEATFLHFSLFSAENARERNEIYIAMTEKNIQNGRPFRVYEKDGRTSISGGIMLSNFRVIVMILLGGFTAGILTAYFLVRVGMMVGAFFHIFYRHDIVLDFWNTVLLHGMIELTMVVISGMAGFMIARTLIFSNILPLKESVKEKAIDSLKLALSIALWLVLAGLLEGFVTGAMLTLWAKLLINATTLLGLAFYFVRFGNLSSLKVISSE